MSQPSLRNNGSWSSPLAAQQVDQACDRFESAWKSASTSSERPPIEDYVGAVAESERAVLLRELLHLDVYYRLVHGEEPQAADYAGRFPGLDPACLADALAAPAVHPTGSSHPRRHPPWQHCGPSCRASPVMRCWGCWAGAAWA